MIVDQSREECERAIEAAAFVSVNGPRLDLLDSDPWVIDFGEAVTLKWNTTYATGVELIVDQGAPRPLGPQWDASNPVRIPVQPGHSYVMRAVGQASDGSRIVSPAQFLALSFNPAKIVSFKADPAVIDAFYPGTQVGRSSGTRLSWRVENSVAGTYQGRQVDPDGFSQESPISAARYTLTALSTDGTPASGPSEVDVMVLGWTPSTDLDLSDNGPATILLGIQLDGLETPGANCTITDVSIQVGGGHLKATGGSWLGNSYRCEVPMPGWTGREECFLAFTYQARLPDQTVRKQTITNLILYGATPQIVTAAPKTSTPL